MGVGWSEYSVLEELVDRAGGRAGELRVLFADLVGRVGLESASHLWWAVFGAQDAAET